MYAIHLRLRKKRPMRCRSGKRLGSNDKGLEGGAVVVAVDRLKEEEKDSLKMDVVCILTVSKED